MIELNLYFRKIAQDWSGRGQGQGEQLGESGINGQRVESSGLFDQLFNLLLYDTEL